MSGEVIDIVAPALVAGLTIALTHAPLGIEVLRRGIIFIDLAVAQIAGLGLVAATMFLHHPSLWAIQAVALACAILAGLFFRKVETTMPKQQEAIIGVGFVLAASLAILLLADHPYGGAEIQHLLSGQNVIYNMAKCLNTFANLCPNLGNMVSKTRIAKGHRLLPAFCLCHHLVSAIGRGVCGVCQPDIARIGSIEHRTTAQNSMAMRGNISERRHCNGDGFRHPRRTDDCGKLCIRCNGF